MSVRMRQFVERQVIGAFVKQALAAGHNLSVNDGEETTLRNSKDFGAIMGALMTTDEDHLYVDARFNKGRVSDMLGEVACIYGNDGYDVISDYHTGLEPLMTEAKKLADYWEEEG